MDPCIKIINKIEGLKLKVMWMRVLEDGRMYLAGKKDAEREFHSLEVIRINNELGNAFVRLVSNLITK